ncbi:hypothetical protein GCM10007415_31460 [Parapedobacter pyrenivorans]|uniref:Uncharacterized protein n=1 Tax=Parapedobacter pyrenivorans TaxID=1305674 RepID=A0A917MCP2_9SPHI|nr:hypothetical protein [Parapedobacter pyrenivorans]GGG94123.1 hypothetical protein GCM10007415_31460 [Parapedobacter pyrenivorans]
MAKTKDVQQEHFENDLLSFIKVKFIEPITINGLKPTIRQYVEITSIGKATIEKLIKSKGYDVPISTIRKICTYSKITLSVFFSMFEEYLKEKESKKKK